MATPRRRAAPPLVETLFEEPYRFDFFQAVRLLDRLDPDRVPVGRDGPPRREVVAVRRAALPGLPRQLDPRPRTAGRARRSARR